MDSLVRDCSKLAKHQAASAQKTQAALDAAIEQLEAARRALAGGAAQGSEVQRAKAQVDRMQAQVAEH
ncbi:hypothetical protein IWW51_006608, partial [Coemansia sp. RSA 2702]